MKRLEIAIYIILCFFILAMPIMFGIIIILAETAIPKSYTLSEIEEFSSMPLTTLARLVLAHQLQWFCVGTIFAYFVYRIQQLRAKEKSKP